MKQRARVSAVLHNRPARIRRPFSVTIIGWSTIINSLLHAAILPQLLSTAVGRKTLSAVGVPIHVAQGWTLASSLTHAIAGIAMLNQRNWGRILYLGFWPVALGLTVLLDGIHRYDIVAAILYGLSFILLTRPGVAAFFHDRRPGAWPTRGRRRHERHPELHKAINKLEAAKKDAVPYNTARRGRHTEQDSMQPSRYHQVRVRRRRFLIINLAWSLGLLVARAAYAEPSGSPSRMLEKGQWELGLGGGGLWKRAMKGGAKVSVYEGSHTRGYGLTNRASLYGTIGGAYVGNDDPSIPTNVSNGFGANLVLGGHLNANLWKTATNSWEWNGSVGYLYMGVPHKRSGNQVNWNEWQLSTSIAKSLGNVKPYAGIKLSALHVDYQLRTDKVTTHGRYQPKGIVGPLLGLDWSFGEEPTTVLNLEGSYIGGAEIDLALTKRF